MNSTISSTPGPRALDVVSLNYFEAIEMLEIHNNMKIAYNGKHNPVFKGYLLL